MKYHEYYLLLLLAILLSCNNSVPEDAGLQQNSTFKSLPHDVQKAVLETRNAIDPKYREPSTVKSPLLVPNQLQKLLPVSFKKWNTVNYTARTIDQKKMRFTQAMGVYKDQNRQIRLAIIDTYLAPLMLLSYQEILSKTPDDTLADVQWVDIYNERAVLTSTKNSKDLIMIWENRFLIQAHGEHVDSDTLVELIEKIDFERVK